VELRSEEGPLPAVELDCIGMNGGLDLSLIVYGLT
jgi:hypothetical protein